MSRGMALASAMVGKGFGAFVAIARALVSSARLGSLRIAEII